MLRLSPFFFSFLFLFGALLFAHDRIPGTPQKHPILLQGGDLHTVSHGVLKATDILFENGRITQIGKNLTLPPETQIIHVHGKQIYPGLLDPYSILGLIEIGAVRATDDTTEVGWVTPEVQSHIAFEPDSELIPTVRSNGVMTILLAPLGELISGRSSLLNLDGWTKEDAMVKANLGVHLVWPPAQIERSWWAEESEEEQEKQRNQKREVLYQSFKTAKQYLLEKAQNPSLPQDSRWEALLPLFTQEMTLFVYADDCRQIEQALYFAQEYQFKMVLTSGRSDEMRMIAMPCSARSLMM
jgi:imidazolonepropionase-like amidohydrolase